MNPLESTPYDVHFRLFGIPVRVHPTFWIFSLCFVWPLQRIGFQYLLGGILLLFLSILFHELGHVIAGRVFGEQGNITLMGMGGVAVGQYHHLASWQRVVVYLSGPAGGFVFYGIAWALRTYHREIFQFQSAAAREGTAVMLWFGMALTLFVNLFNLLPIYPMDGGQILREGMTKISRRDGLYWTFLVSFLTALAVIGAILLFMYRPLLKPAVLGNWDLRFTAIFIGLFALTNLMSLLSLRQERRGPWNY